MLVMGTTKRPAHPVGEFVRAQHSIELLHDLALAMRTHFGSMEFSHGLCFGSRQLTILTPASLPLSFTSRLCLPSHRLTSLEMCQLAFSQIRRRVFLPSLSWPSQHHERNRVLIVLTGLPSTKLIHISSRRGR
jgi:hypothetical protein